MSKEQETLLEESNLPEGCKMHENGIPYKELPMEGLDEPLKIFNTIKPQRLKGETQVEYKIRRRFIVNADKEKKKKVFYNPAENTQYVEGVGVRSIPYTNPNKKDKFNKKKKK